MGKFRQVDVFTSVPFYGNPVAVFFDADELSDREMLQIAKWTNLSETTFVQKTTIPGADYKVKIFTPGGELPFAGHPTIGTCHAVIEAGIASVHDGVIFQECGAGLIRIHVRENGVISFELPYAKAVESSLDVSNIIGSAVLKSETFDVGPVWHTALLRSAEAVLALQPDVNQIKKVCIDQGWTGIQALGEKKNGTYELRTFAPAVGVNEDPVCGSGSGAAMAMLRLPHAEIFQGEKVARKGHVILTNENGTINVGGHAVTVVTGEY